MNIVNPQIYVMAFITFCISSAGWGTLFYKLGFKNRKLISAAVIMLPFSLLVNLFVKNPLNKFVVTTFNINAGFSIHQPVWYIIFLAFLPPITEELIKVLPYLFPKIRDLIKSHGLWVGAWSGLGFGLGELLYIAWGVSIAELYKGIPWFAFTGYLGERVAVCLIHAILTGILFNFIRQGKAIQGYGLAVVLHLGVNSGAILLALNIIQPWLTSVLLAIMMVVSVIIFEKYRKQWEISKTDTGLMNETVYFQRN